MPPLPVQEARRWRDDVACGKLGGPATNKGVGEQPSIMKTLERILKTHPHANSAPLDELNAASDALLACVEACTICADACLAEEHATNLRRCIRATSDCADICTATLRVVARQTETVAEMVRQQVHACLVACQLCAEECDRHDHTHCKVCARACRECQEACNRLLGEIGSDGVVTGDPMEP